MKKNIAVFGGSLFQDIKIENGKYHLTSKQSIIKLSKNYDFDNFSNQFMTSQKAWDLIRQIQIQRYSDCILALGEQDLDQLELFKYNMLEIVKYLEENQVHILMVSLPQEVMNHRNANQLQDFLDQLVLEHNIDYIYDGKTDKIVSYSVLNDQEMQKAILELC